MMVKFTLNFLAISTGRMYSNKEFGGVAKRPKATVCKTVIRRFESARRLFFLTFDFQGLMV